MVWLFVKDQKNRHRVTYSITSSTRASGGAGTVRPSAFAVLKLIVSSNFVGCRNGKSAAFAPLRIRPP